MTSVHEFIPTVFFWNDAGRVKQLSQMTRFKENNSELQDIISEKPILEEEWAVL